MRRQKETRSSQLDQRVGRIDLKFSGVGEEPLPKKSKIVKLILRYPRLQILKLNKKSLRAILMWFPGRTIRFIRAK